MAKIGKITQVIGSTFDAEFPEGMLPPIYNAVKVEINTGESKSTLVGEISKHLGGGRVRCVALGSTEGLRRGSDCVDVGAPVSVPVGEATLGRVFNVLGEAIDGRGAVAASDKRAIHQPAPSVGEVSPNT